MKVREVFVKLTNRKARLVSQRDIFDLPDEMNEVLKYRKPGWDYTNQAKYNGWDGYTLMVTPDGIMGAGVFLAMQKKLEKELAVRFVVKDLREFPVFQNAKPNKIESDKEVRKYQVECLGNMIAASQTGGLVLNATGTGKTYVAGTYFKTLRGAALFLVDELTLLKQAKKELQEVLGEEVGEIGNSIWDVKRITVGTIQTVHKHRFGTSYVNWTKLLSCIVIDELHLALNRRNFETIRAIKPMVIFGLTATLELKKKHVAMRAYDLCGPVIFEYPLKQGVAEGVLSKGVVVAVQVKNEQEQEKYEGKGGWWRKRQFYRERYPTEYLRLIVEGSKRNNVIRKLVLEAHKKGKHTVVLLERVQHLKELSESLTVPHHLVFGEKLVEERVESQQMFEDEKVKVILANKVFKKGINIKRIDVIIDGAAMKSKNDAQQKYGRGVRLCEGKTGLIYFDIADVGNRFEKAAKSRRSALKKNGTPVFLANSELGASKILELAEKKLAKLAGPKQRKLNFEEGEKNEET
jgi:superfamily II DNA or RNA helicase